MLHIFTPEKNEELCRVVFLISLILQIFYFLQCLCFVLGSQHRTAGGSHKVPPRVTVFFFSVRFYFDRSEPQGDDKLNHNPHVTVSPLNPLCSHTTSNTSQKTLSIPTKHLPLLLLLLTLTLIPLVSQVYDYEACEHIIKVQALTFLK